MVKVGGYILGEFGNLIAGDPRSGYVVLVFISTFMLLFDDTLTVDIANNGRALYRQIQTEAACQTAIWIKSQ